MSFLDKLKSFFSGGTSNGGVQATAEPDAARAMDDPAGVAATPMPPTDPVGMPTGEPQPAEPQAGEGDANDPEDRLE